jgi:hypothetical protein
MIFYIATDQDGKKHVLTVATEAKAIDKDFLEIDQPNDKAALKHLLQESFDAVYRLQGIINSLKHDAAINDTPAPSAEPTPVAALPEPPQQVPAVPVQSSWTATQIEDFILNDATVAQVENIYSCLGNRFAELAKKLLKLQPDA